MAVTTGEAMAWPSLPQNSLLPRATAVASREWPQASWKMTPPNPPAITTGISPAGHWPAFSMVRAVSAAARPAAAGSTRSNSS